MKRYLLFTIGLLLMLSSVSLGQETKTATPAASPKPKPAMSKAQIQKTLVATEKKLWEAWKNKDPKPFNATLAADSFMLGENGVSDKATAIKEITGMD